MTMYEEGPSFGLLTLARDAALGAGASAVFFGLVVLFGPAVFFGLVVLFGPAVFFGLTVLFGLAVLFGLTALFGLAVLFGSSGGVPRPRDAI